MSSLQVKVTTIERMLPHPNADRLEIAHIGGWQVVVPKGEHKTDDRVVYFPPDTVLPAETSDRFGVTKYLSKGRIKVAKLRGEPSFGLVVRPDDPEWELDTDVAAHYGATKYEPPVRVTAGDAAPDHPLFPAYTDIENLRNFADVLLPGELVAVTEKLHGTSARVGIVGGERMGGSRTLRRAEPATYTGSTYWMPWTVPGVTELVEYIAATHPQVVLYGEVYGRKIQSLNYGLTEGIGFRAFDLLIDGKYVDQPTFAAICQQFGVETVPLLAIMPYDLEAIRRLSGGATTMMASDAHIREGVVVRPIIERNNPKTGRTILKYVSDAYLFGDASDFTDQ